MLDNRNSTADPGMDFRVIDTEGHPVLREVAVIDSHGQLLYEARTSDQEESYYAADLVRPLPDLLGDLRGLLQGHQVVAHNALHDRGVLEASFRSCALNPPHLDWICTLDLAQALHPGLDSYALAALCDQLSIGAEPFCRDAAHLAAYDARYTYLLFRHLQRVQHCRRLIDAPNPFSSSRVDTPFQTFADDRLVNQAAFQRLSAVLKSVAADPNQQSQGAVLLGEPGAGKTHLVMRLAREVLQNNRLLFIRQPTQAGHVLFHIYSRTLESLVERVGDGAHSQLDLLLIRSIRRILAGDGTATNRDREIIAALDAEDLARLGQEGSDARRQRWERIEVRLLRWWGDQQGAAGFGRQMLQGLLRFCRYNDPRLRESCRRWLATGEHEPVAQELDGLSPWNEAQLREDFSLQALRVMGLLCSLDQPLILVFDQLEGLWLEGNRSVLMRFGQVVKELFTHVPHALILLTLFPDRWQQFQNDFDGSVTDRVGQHLIPLEQPRTDQIEEIVDLRLQTLGATPRSLFTADELDSILRQPSIRSCLNRAGALYEHHVHGVPLQPAGSARPARSLKIAGEGRLQAWLERLECQLEQIGRRLELLEHPQPPCQSSGLSAPPPGKGDPSVAKIPEVIPAIDRTDAQEPFPSTAVLDSSEADFLRYREAALKALQQRWNVHHIVDETDDAGKLSQICKAHQQILPLEVSALRLGNRRVPENVLIRQRRQSWCVAFLHVNNAQSIQARLRNLNQLVMHHRDINFMLMRDGFASTISSNHGIKEKEAFRNGVGDGHKRNHWVPLNHERRVTLEFTYQLVMDMHNGDVDIPLSDGLRLLANHEPDNWIVRLLRSA